MLIAKAALSTSLALTSFITTANPLLAVVQTAKDTSVSSSVAIPETPAGRQMASWLKAFNSGDEKQLRAFHTASGAAERIDRRTRQDANFYKQTRGLELKQIETSTEYEITVVARAKLTEAWCRVSMKVAPEPSNNILAYNVRVASNPAPAARGTLSEADLVKSLSAYLDKLVNADVFSGTVLVAKNGKPLFAKAYGFA
ncbi:MAG: hypothetical protein WAV20_15515, partial [Blastocatellia bacterium]